MTKLNSMTRTEIGCVRSHNEDASFADDQIGLYVVCDGMGGHACGEVAARVAIDSVATYFRGRRSELESLDESADSLARLKRWVTAAVREANSEICYLAEQSAHLRGMGTTITLLLIRGSTGVIAHCGDSRAYAIHNGLELLTNDHNLAAELQAEGVGGADGDDVSPFAHILTRCLGRSDAAEPDVRAIKVCEGDRFLLCSDGLARYLSSDQARSMLRETDQQRLTNKLIEFAIESGGHDNIATVLIDVGGADDKVAATRTRVGWRTIRTPQR